MKLAKFVQRSKTKEDLEHNIETLRKYCVEEKLENFLTWFENEWLSDDWLDTWVDVNRQSREGLFNTNDFTEALLVNIIVETVFPFYESKIEQEINRQDNFRVRDRTRKLASRMERALAIVEDFPNEIQVAHDGTSLMAIVPSAKGPALVRTTNGTANDANISSLEFFSFPKMLILFLVGNYNWSKTPKRYNQIWREENLKRI